MNLKLNKNTVVTTVLHKINETLIQHNLCELQKVETMTVVSELINNVLSHTPEGEIEITFEKEFVNIFVRDFGTGIQDVSNSIKEGFSTAGTLGIGLPSIIRLCDELEIETSKKGTVIHCKKILK
jgi:anti-sigma regulatory factor (Ser/Thr protein kinase)